MAVERYKTASEVILSAGRELGLGSVQDPFSATDDNWVQLTQMLNSIGRELADTYTWENLTREHTFPTVAGVSAYALPADYLAAIDDTLWDRTSQEPLLGPLTAQEWHQLQASPVNTTPTLGFRFGPNVIELTPAASVPAGHTIAFELRSLAWVRPAAAGPGAGTSYGETLGEAGADECVAPGDIPLYDPLLLHYALKLWWKKDRGFDTSAAEADFVRTLENAKGRAKGARSLVVGGSRRHAFVNERNLPWP